MSEAASQHLSSPHSTAVHIWMTQGDSLRKYQHNILHPTVYTNLVELYSGFSDNNNIQPFYFVPFYERISSVVTRFESNRYYLIFLQRNGYDQMRRASQQLSSTPEYLQDEPHGVLTLRSHEMK